MRRCSLLFSPLAVAISSLALINILKLFLSSVGTVLGSGRSSPRAGSAACGGVGFLILSMIEPNLRSMIYGDASVSKRPVFSLGLRDPSMPATGWDTFEAGSEYSCDIVTRTRLNVRMARSSNSTCSLVGWYGSPTKSRITEGPFAPPKMAWFHMLGKLKKTTMKYQNRRVLFG